LSIAREHIPAFMPGIEARWGEYHDLASLMALPWVRGWSYRWGFKHFVVSGNQLIAVQTQRSLEELRAEKGRRAAQAGGSDLVMGETSDANLPTEKYVVATLDDVPAGLPQEDP
jgi:hypothetical protein